MSVHSLMQEIEIQFPVAETSTWRQLKAFIEDEFPALTPIHVHSVYKMVAKGIPRRLVVTKENSKTWVMYETADSARPGVRWMIGKTWFTQENIQRDVAQSYSLPPGTKLK